MGALDNARFLDVLDVELIDGEWRLKVGDLYAGKGVYPSASPWGMTGIVAIPDPPDATGACQAVVETDGSESFAWWTKDTRYAAKIGGLPLGSRGLITRAEARILLNPESDQVTIYTVNQKVDLSQMIDLNGSEGTTIILCGNSVISMDDESITLAVNGGGAIIIDKDGVQISGGGFAAVCSKVLLGDFDDLGHTPPATPANAIAYSSAGPTNVVSSKVFVAP